MNWDDTGYPPAPHHKRHFYPGGERPGFVQETPATGQGRRWRYPVPPGSGGRLKSRCPAYRPSGRYHPGKYFCGRPGGNPGGQDNGAVFPWKHPVPGCGFHHSRSGCRSDIYHPTGSAAEFPGTAHRQGGPGTNSRPYPAAYPPAQTALYPPDLHRRPQFRPNPPYPQGKPPGRPGNDRG